MYQKHDLYGFKNNVNGSMAEYMRFPPEALVYKIPKDMPVEQGLLVKPAAAQTLRRPRRSETRTLWCCPAGRWAWAWSKPSSLASRHPQVVLDMNDTRLAKAKAFSADIVMNPGKEDVIKKIVEMTDGYGCDIYIEATGHPSSVQQGLEMIRKMGRFVEFSVFKDLVTVDWSIISDRKELDALGAHLSPYCYEPVIKWIEDGNLPTDGVVSLGPLEQWQDRL